MWIDTHCHLDAAEFAADRDAVAAAACAAGVTRIVVPAVCADSFAAVRDCCARYPGCRAAYGIHPLFVDRAREADLATLADWLAREPALAVGEIGLDYFVAGLDRERQRHFFERQLAIARDFDLPVLLHVRRAIDDVIAALRRLRPRGGIAHAFNGSRQQADALIALGFKLGFGGAMTSPRATHLRDLAATLPADAIVLETDAPDIPPAFAPGVRNVPENLPRIAATLAELRGLPLAGVARITSANARSLFPALAA